MASYGEDKEDLLLRLRRVEGQVKGIRRMIEEDRYCVDILTQVSSVIAASHKVAAIVLRDHIRGCVREALSSQAGGDHHIEELISVIEAFSNKK